MILFIGFVGCLWACTPGEIPQTRRSLLASDRITKLETTRAEIARLAAEYHARLPREKARQIGAAYARYSTAKQDSVTDQIRAIFEDAVSKGVFIPLDQIFFDLGARGYSGNREGLKALKACLAAKSAQVAFFFSTSRLYRKMYQSVRFVEEEIIERGIRAVFVKSRIDTADAKTWKMIFNIYSMQDEAVVGMYAENIRESNITLLLRGHVFGSIPFGYKGEHVGTEMTRRNTPRRKYAIDPAAAEVVRSIYRWYVTDRVTRADIVRRLNTDPYVPPHRLLVQGRWSLRTLTRLLRNPKYRGQWAYGTHEAIWQGSKDYVRQFPRKEALKTVQWEDLRIVPDEIWYEAQSRLATEVVRTRGRRPKDGDTASRPRVLGGLFFCPTHNRPLYVSGKDGKWLTCTSCRETEASQRPLFAQLCRTLALTRTCEALAKCLRDDVDLVEAGNPDRRRGLAEARPGGRRPAPNSNRVTDQEDRVRHRQSRRDRRRARRGAVSTDDVSRRTGPVVSGPGRRERRLIPVRVGSHGRGGSRPPREPERRLADPLAKSPRRRHVRHPRGH